MIKQLAIDAASPLRRNIAANLAGRGVIAVLGVIFIPVYLRFLGIEAYGLVGFYATIYSLFALLDVGLAATINRELARLSAGDGRRQEQRNILRTLEACYWPLCLAIGALVFSLSPYIARHWIQATHLPTISVERTIQLMSVVLALQIPFAFYQGALMGLQRQVLLNAIVVTTAVIRSVGTALVLWLVSPTTEAFFLCQAAVSVLQTGAAVVAVWTVLGSFTAGRFESARFVAVRGFAAATAANSIVTVGLAQIDKVLLSKLLPLDQFGYYALAGTVTALVWAIVVPIDQAVFPRFAELFELGDRKALSSLYHRGTQLMSVALGPVSAVVVLFSWRLIHLWTRNADAADHAYLIAALLIAGTTLNGLVSIPVNLQAAAGWPQLIMYINVVGAVLVVPAILGAVPVYGPVGAAAVWLTLNAAYVCVNVPLMHVRILQGEQWRWYVRDVGAPIAAAVAVVGLLRYVAPADAPPWVYGVYAFGCWAAAVAASALAAGDIRAAIFDRKARPFALFAD